MNYMPTHIGAQAEDLASSQPGGRIVFLPGSAARAERIASAFDERRTIPAGRGHDVSVGQVPGANGPVDVACVSTGMGCPSVGIIVTELVELGVRRLIRVGSAGGLQDDIHVGDVVVATAAVRDEHASNAFAPLEFPALASRVTTGALIAAAAEARQAGTLHAGVAHSKDSLHGREFGFGPLAEQNEAYMRHIAQLGCLASEMEASHLFILGRALAGRCPTAPAAGEEPLEVGCILAILGGVAGASEPAAREQAEEWAIRAALGAAGRLV